MKKIVTLVALTLVGLKGFSQQRILVSQYMLNQYLLNPAVGGTGEFIEAYAGYRLQWVGLEGAPRTFYLTAHAPVGKAASNYNWRTKKSYFHGIGGYLVVDKTGLVSRTQAYLSYAYNMRVTKKIRWSTGAFLGFQQYRIDGTGVVMDGRYDPALPGVDMNKLFPDLSLGTWLYSPDFYVGASVNQIFRNRLDFSVNKITNDIGRLNYHYYLTGGYRIPFYYNLMEWIPSVMIRYVKPAPVSFDLNSKFRYKKMYWAGVSYRHEDAIAVLAGITLAKSILLGYSYDISISKLAPYHANSHEIVVGYSPKKREGVLSPNMFW